MRTSLLLILGLVVLVGQAATAGGRTPSFRVNGATHLAQIGLLGRVHLDYDVRSLGAAGVHVVVHRWPLATPNAGPDLEWRFWSPAGPREVRFGNLPVGVYRVLAVAVDAQGEPMALPSVPVYVEYGGRRAWQGMQRDVDLRAEAPPFAGVGVWYVPAEDMPRVEVSPATSVVKPGQEVLLQATVRNLAADSPVEWTLEGPGELEPLPDGQARYRAPGGDSNRVARIHCQVPGTGATGGGATVLVTSVEVGP